MKNGGDDLRYFKNVVDRIETLLSCSAGSSHIRLNQEGLRMIRTRYISKINRYYEKNASAHVCIIHTRKECIAVGINDSVIIPSSVPRHAEVDAICRLLQKRFRFMSSMRLMVVRFCKTGGISCSTPCDRCSRFIEKRLFMFETIAFSDENGQIVIIIADDFDAQKFIHVSRRNRLLSKKKIS